MYVAKPSATLSRAAQNAMVKNFSAELEIATLEVPIPLDELMADGPDESARRLGSILIHVLMLWHKEEFARIAAGTGAQSQAISDMDLVDSLISKSISLKTNVHVGSIEHLLANSADESGECQEFSTLTWPTIRAELLKYGDDGVT